MGSIRFPRNCAGYLCLCLARTDVRTSSIPLFLYIHTIEHEPATTPLAAGWPECGDDFTAIRERPSEDSIDAISGRATRILGYLKHHLLKGRDVEFGPDLVAQSAGFTHPRTFWAGGDVPDRR